MLHLSVPFAVLALLAGCMGAPPPEPPAEPDEEPDGEATLPGTPALAETPAFRLVRVGHRQACGIYADGSLRCWGDLSFDPLPGPFVDVQLGAGRILALTASGDLVQPDGKVVRSGVEAFSLEGKQQECWVAGGTLDCNTSRGSPPKGGKAVGVLARPWGEGCAWDAAQRFTCWGAEGTDEPGPPYTHVAGGRRGCGLRENGFVHCWGDGSLAKVPSGTFRSVDVDGSGACAVRRERGEVVCWGLGIPDEAIPTGAFVDVALGDRAACALDGGGRVHCWGDLPDDRIPYDDTPAVTGQVEGASSARFAPLRDQRILDLLDAREGDVLYRGPFGPADDGVVGTLGVSAILLVKDGDGWDHHAVGLAIDPVDAVSFADTDGDGSLEMLVIGRRSTGPGSFTPDNALVRWTGTRLVHAPPPDAAKEAFEAARSVDEARKALGL
ncbi:MAG: hypothetical protein H6737_01560 [Alphaproteobacteria bacterium]|nr:hypothetical protein [Alphaproteobacteria bacterium]